ncbi:hypothetical protein [Streptomyces sp. NPDC007355]|uniref:hypothetical protein n=1 Tax=Streptomyces sp. NPDC007355 TaxID=3364778 RepID=UPI0036A54337
MRNCASEHTQAKQDRTPVARPPLLLRALDVLSQLAAELRDLPPLPAVHWQTLARIVNGTVIDTTWIEQPGQLLSYEIEDFEEGHIPDSGALIAACRSWSRAQAVAVIDAILRDETALLPVEDNG